MPKLDAIIFDIDGTMVDVSRSYLETIRQTASFFLDRQVSKSEVDSIKSQPSMNNDWDATYALVSQYAPANYLSIKAKFQNLYLSKLINNERLLVKPILLKKLSSKYKLGIVTGRPKDEAIFVLTKFAILKYFQSDAIVCMEDTAKGKPDPSPLFLCQKRLNTKNCIYVGDSINDKLAASAANMKYYSVEKTDINHILPSLASANIS